MKTRFACTIALAMLCCSAPAFAWGSKGHTIVNHLAALSFAGRMPAFLTGSWSAYEIGFLGPEPDELKDAGRSWDADYDPGHYVDLRDDGSIAGAVWIDRLAADRQAYDTALRASNTDQYKQGYLPYAILDGWEQLRKDFAYWRVDNYTASRARTRAARLIAVDDRSIEESITKRDLGMWGHFVADACQPLHVTVHFNGWGPYPNPNGYTQDRTTHSQFESEFVDRYVSEKGVAQLMQHASSLSAPTALISQTDVMKVIARYLLASNRTVAQLYDIEKTGGFGDGSPQAIRFTQMRLAAGAMELRDLSVWAWQDSLYATVGYPNETVRDVLSGKAPWPQR